MSYDSGLADRVRDSLRRLGERAAREKNVFGGRGFLLGKTTFLIVGDEELILKSAPDEYESCLARPGVTPFAPGGERPMSTWLVVPQELVADDPELADWVALSLRGGRATPLAKKKPAGATKKPASPKRPAVTKKKTVAKKKVAKKRR
jgi:TfoX/Sxy family transcriptional regulator of competence genes